MVPALAVIDWVVFGPGADAGSTWWTAAELADPADLLPGGLLQRAQAVREPLYPFLDPDAASFWRWVAIMIAVFIVVGFAVWAIGLLRSTWQRGHH